MKPFICMSLAVVAVTAFGQEPQRVPTDPSKWVEAPAPVRGSMEYVAFAAAARGSFDNWVVSAADGRVVVKQKRDASSSWPEFSVTLGEEQALYRGSAGCAARVEDGWLVGYDHGEWGGAAWWFSTDGRRRHELTRGNVCSFARNGKDWFAIGGLNHLVLNEGHVYRLRPKDGRWSGEPFAELPEAGLTAAGAGDGLVVVTTTKVVRVDEKGKVSRVVEGVDWFSSPTSVCNGPTGVVYVGLRKFVAAVDPAGKPPAVKLLVPTKEFLAPGR